MTAPMSSSSVDESPSAPSAPPETGDAVIGSDALPEEYPPVVIP